MQRKLDVLSVESCASNTSSSTVTSEVDSSNANVDGPIATSSGTGTRSSGACDNVSYPEAETVEIDDEDELKSKYFVSTSFFLSWYAKDQLKKNGCFLVNDASKKKISSSYKSRGNLRSHNKSKHTGALAIFDKLCKAHDNRQQQDTDRNNARTGTCDKSNKPVSSSTGLITSTKLTQTNFDLFVTKYIVESGLPFNHIDSDAFHNFIKQVAPKMKLKSRIVYSAKAEELTKSLKTELQKNFGKAEKVCLAIDHWTSYRKGCVGFTAHWYTNQLIRQNACIAIRSVIGHCTFDVLAQLTESVIMEFKLTNKVAHCITDSGSNFVKAFAEFSCPAQADN